MLNVRLLDRNKKSRSYLIIPFLNSNRDELLCLLNREISRRRWGNCSFTTRDGHFCSSYPIPFYHLSSFFLRLRLLPSVFFEKISKHTDSLFRSSFHVAFAFVKFLSRKTDGEATVLGSWRVEKLWPLCETFVALFSARMSLPNSLRESFFSYSSRIVSKIECFITFIVSTFMTVYF